jgi:uncharacterized protein (TIGR02599 family)
MRNLFKGREGRQGGPARRKPLHAFTLVELLVASALLIIIVGVLFHLIQSATTVFNKSNQEIAAFQSARDAFDAITRTLSVATLDNYYDYVDSSGAALSATNSTTFVPSSYQRTSNLCFVSGTNLLPQQITHAIFFQAPLGRSFAYPALDGLLNACGYFVAYNQDSPPSFFPPGNPRYRYQLMEYVQPSENLSVYAGAAAGGSNQWFTTDLTTPASTDVHLIANNIIALIIQPRNPSAETTGTSLSLAPNYEYNSGAVIPPSTQPLNQHPRVVEVIIVAVDESSIIRYPDFTQSDESKTVIHKAMNSAQPPLFTKTNQFQQQADAALQSDLQTLMNYLTAQHINYRVFQSQVVLRGANM